MIEIWFGPGKQRSVHANWSALSDVGATDRISYSLRALVFVDAYESVYSSITYIDFRGHTKQWVLASSRRIWNRVTWTIFPPALDELELALSLPELTVRGSSDGKGLL
jgi:hypothetical protein